MNPLHKQFSVTGVSLNKANAYQLTGVSLNKANAYQLTT